MQLNKKLKLSIIQFNIQAEGKNPLSILSES